MLGTFAVGKSSLVQRFTYNRFDERYLSTLGVKVSQKSLFVPAADEVTKLNLLIWDIDGRTEWNSVRGSYLRGAAGAMLVCDMTRQQTFDELTGFLQALQKASPQCKIVIVGNKSDLTEFLELSAETLQDFAETLSTTCFITSAKSGDGVEDAFRYLGQLLMQG